MKEVQLTHGYIAIIDDEDYERVARIRWYPVSKGEGAPVYARSWKLSLFMHRFIMNPPADKLVAHIDDNGLHNWKANLLITTHSVNATLSNGLNKCPHGHDLISYNVRMQGTTKVCRLCEYTRHKNNYFRRLGIIPAKIEEL